MEQCFFVSMRQNHQNQSVLCRKIVIVKSEVKIEGTYHIIVSSTLCANTYTILDIWHNNETFVKTIPGTRWTAWKESGANLETVASVMLAAQDQNILSLIQTPTFHGSIRHQSLAIPSPRAKVDS